MTLKQMGICKRKEKGEMGKLKKYASLLCKHYSASEEKVEVSLINPSLT